MLLLTPGTPGDENDWTSGGGSADVMFDNVMPPVHGGFRQELDDALPLLFK